MTLEEAIKHCEEVAETQEENCKYAGHDHYTKLEASACAAEHRQLAEWLKELKTLRKQDVPDTNDGDMISRQAAIDAVRQLRVDENDYSDLYHDGYVDGVYDAEDSIKAVPSAQPGAGQSVNRLTNKEWIDFLSEQFDISRTSAREMLHGMMQWKKEDNFKKTFNPRKEEK